MPSVLFVGALLAQQADRWAFEGRGTGIAEESWSDTIVTDGDGTLTVTGNSRGYMVVDHTQSSWGAHAYERFDLLGKTLRPPPR